MDTVNSLMVQIIPDTIQGGFTALVPGIAAYGEGESEDAALADLREALTGYTEAFGMSELLARHAVPAGTIVRNYQIEDLVRA